MSAPPSDALPVGATLQNGAFIIDGVLSQSNFAITYRGRDAHLQRPVAIKEYFPLGCARRGQTVETRLSLIDEFERAKSRFLDEARGLARFHHPGIVGVHAFFAENNTAYLVMEFVDGETLEQRVEREGTLPPDVALQYIHKIGAALQDVHAAGLLHCDIKPENVIVSHVDAGAALNVAAERVVLIDFGLTTRLEETQSYTTRHLSDSGALGTPGYAPIEQYANGARVGIPTDIYALGATLYRLLTGHVPTPAADRASGAEWLPPHRLNPRLDRGLSNAVAWALQLTPAARPANIATWLQSLDEATARERAQQALLALLQTRAQQMAMGIVATKSTKTGAGAVPQSAASRSTSPRPAAYLLTPPAPTKPMARVGVGGASATAFQRTTTPAPRRAQTDQMVDDQNCLSACFVGCLVIWFIGAALTFVGWALRFMLVGW